MRSLRLFGVYSASHTLRLIENTVTNQHRLWDGRQSCFKSSESRTHLINCPCLP
jgi:hypothetical protein